uniref:Uncharacterized protein n=1 Tax=Ditylenchus dipsaci TaxID=166011 RepID=A0A915D6F4_9BILA
MTESSLLKRWDVEDACELVGDMNREIRRQYALKNAGGSLVDPMKNLLNSSNKEDSKQEHDNWISSFQNTL